MSKFKKKKKGLPAINTASLPDIVFMLLFFFMVATTMREEEQLVKISKPFATEVKKLTDKTMITNILVGKDRNNPDSNEDIIQLGDKVASINQVTNFVREHRNSRSEEEQKYMTTNITADINCSVGTITDIKEKLRDINALKINYNTKKGDATKNQ